MGWCKTYIKTPYRVFLVNVTKAVSHKSFVFIVVNGPAQ